MLTDIETEVPTFVMEHICRDFPRFHPRRLALDTRFLEDLPWGSNEEWDAEDEFILSGMIAEDHGHFRDPFLSVLLERAGEGLIDLTE